MEQACIIRLAAALRSRERHPICVFALMQPRKSSQACFGVDAPESMQRILAINVVRRGICASDQQKPTQASNRPCARIAARPFFRLKVFSLRNARFAARRLLPQTLLRPGLQLLRRPLVRLALRSRQALRKPLVRKRGERNRCGKRTLRASDMHADARLRGMAAHLRRGA